jgi:hypothetical protein
MKPSRFDAFARFVASPRLSRRNLIAAAGGGMTAVGLAGAAAQPATPIASPPAGDEVTWLLLQRFASATLSPESDGASLRIEGLESSVLAFADHPARLVRSLPVAEAWSWVPDPANPPNATLLALPADGGNDVAVVLELLETNFDATADQVTASVRLLAEAPDGDLRNLATPSALPEPRHYGAGHLFIDDLGDTPIGDCEGCDTDPSYFLGRFQDCMNDPTNDCDFCVGWVGCLGNLDTGSLCGVRYMTC